MLSKYDWISLDIQGIVLSQTSIFKIHIPEVINEIHRLKAELLSKNEKERINRFKFTEDKERFSTARVVLKLLLENISGISLAALDFNFSPSGKPYFKNIEFNLSHSENYVLIALSNKPVGIDIEIPKENFDFEPILKNTFGSDEINYINSHIPRKESFLTLWTRKEALLKATGEGLTDELTSISVLDEKIIRTGLKYTLNSFKINDTDVASVAHLGTSEKLNTYEITPTFFFNLHS